MYMDLSMKEEEKAKRVRGAVAPGQHDDRVRAVIVGPPPPGFVSKPNYTKSNQMNAPLHSEIPI